MERIVPGFLCLFAVSALLEAVKSEIAKRDVESFFTREKCIDGLGCFSAAAPFFNFLERPISLLPDDRESINTRFALYTRDFSRVPMNFSNLDNSLDYLDRSGFNPHISTKFIVPGYMSKVAPHWKMKRTGITPESVHIIGHSLGSHIAGYAGKRLRSLGRITGFGLVNSIAHFDFFPNGGHLQPGCPDMGSAVLSFLSHPTLDADGLHDLMCNHGRAIDLFISSIMNHHCVLNATQCDNWEKYMEGKCGDCGSNTGKLCVPLGIHSIQYAEHIHFDSSLNFYLNTTDREPYWDCKMERELKSKNISEEISDDDETCSKGSTSWLDFPAAFMQNSMDSMFSSWSKKSTGPTFLYFSRRNGQEPDYVTNANFTSWNLNEYDFDPKIKTIFIISGFKDSNAPWTRKLKDALILREDCNVFIVEYVQPSETYSDAFKNSPEIGKQVAIFIQNLRKSKHLDLQHVHIIGHSLGAQIAGFAGQEIKKAEKRSLGRVTGFGFSDTSGHFDFYPNGGQLQPGCLTSSQFLGKMNFSVTKSAFKYLFGKLEQMEKRVVDRMLCSHIRSYELFTASILNGGCKFHSVQCSGWKRYASGQCHGNDKVAMGYYADEYKDDVENVIPKKFYLETTANLPYCN
ncbi:Pancreatic triacylglycerol lipase like protein [Argiope bruennichi]|uniref:Pancreatic triacylglycerol lipase like protein n=1 Tax=Argiope bruennichi TaxID=94029 RepID=A0A8T0FG19_ARGBR|nr:Pancreatic triacylglycerol lipase like protein [Argiope bruennichi]